MTSESKKNLSENDPLQLFVKKCLNFLSSYKNYLIFLFIVLFILIAGSFLYLQNQEKVLQIAKKNLVKAQDKSKEKKYKESEKIFLKVINTNIHKNITNRAKLGLANVYKSEKNYKKAIETLKSAKIKMGIYKEGKIDIEYELVSRSLISNYMKTNNCEEISRLLKLEFKITKKDDLYLELGRCYTKKGSTKKSLEVFKQLLNKYPKSPFVTNRIKILKSNGKI